MSIKETRRNEDVFYTTLSFSICEESITTCFSSVLEEIMEQYSVPEENIVDAQFTRTYEKGQKRISVKIKYCNFDIQEFETLDDAKQIRFVLKLIGYADKDIKSISYKKYWSNSNDLVWVATVSDSNHNFYPDESFSERDYELRIQAAIRGVLNFQVIVDFV